MRVSRNVSTAHSRPPRPKVTTVTKFYGACVCLFFCLCVLVICTGNLLLQGQTLKCIEGSTDIKMHWGFKHPVLLVWSHGSWIGEFYKAKLWSMCIFPRWMKCWGKCPANDSKLFAFLRDEVSSSIFVSVTVYMFSLYSCLLLFVFISPQKFGRFIILVFM